MSVTAPEILEAIDQSYRDETESRARKYIGASVIGHRCDAAIAYNLRGFPNVEPDPQLKRIFALGHRLEAIVMADLKRAEASLGVRFLPVDPVTSKPFEYLAHGGHIRAHTDGQVVAGDEVLVLEIKSMNQHAFDRFRKYGVRVSHRHYYDQVTMYMGLSGCTRSLLVGYNKNRSVYHAETVAFDPFEWSFLHDRIHRVINNEAEMIATDKSDWRCKGCFKRGVCWGEAEPHPECSACQYAKPLDSNRDWWCTHRNRRVSEDCHCSDYRQYRAKARSL
ncbi:hypothetical protein GCM10023116_48400 [Kistimonas scapharcae]|uniref:PD-(D/E)XK endonuclease-like domain-containing protein n=1 Tax=Kistimonas scapharcae TaxID=1036133 RepID=A0ABP8V9I5_9GAMM